MTSPAQADRGLSRAVKILSALTTRVAPATSLDNGRYFVERHREAMRLAGADAKEPASS